MTLLTNAGFWVALGFWGFFLIFGKKVVTALNGALDKSIAKIAHDVDTVAAHHSKAQKKLDTLRHRYNEIIGETYTLLENTTTRIAQMEEAHKAEKKQRAIDYEANLDIQLAELARAYTQTTEHLVLTSLKAAVVSNFATSSAPISGPLMEALASHLRVAQDKLSLA